MCCFLLAVDDEAIISTDSHVNLFALQKSCTKKCSSSPGERPQSRSVCCSPETFRALGLCHHRRPTSRRFQKPGQICLHTEDTEDKTSIDQIIGYHIMLALIDEQRCFFGSAHYDEQKFTLGGESLQALTSHIAIYK